MQKRDLAINLIEDCDAIGALYRDVPWNSLTLRDFDSYKDKPARVKFMLDAAQKVVDQHFGPLAEKCRLFHDKVIELEKNEVEDGSGAKDFLLEIAQAADTLCKGLDKEAIEKHLKHFHIYITTFKACDRGLNVNID